MSTPRRPAPRSSGTPTTCTGLRAVGADMRIMASREVPGRETGRTDVSVRIASPLSGCPMAGLFDSGWRPNLREVACRPSSFDRIASNPSTTG